MFDSFDSFTVTTIGLYNNETISLSPLLLTENVRGDKILREHISTLTK